MIKAGETDRERLVWCGLVDESNILWLLIPAVWI